MSNLKKMKKIIIRFIVLFIPFFIYTGQVEAQNIKFSCTLDSTLINNQFRYSITVTLPDNVTTCTVSLFEKEPNKSYHLIDKKEHIIAGSCTFYTSERRSWMVMVESGNQNNSKIIK